MQELEQKKFQRQIAYKVRVSDILNASFTKDELSAGYIELNGANVSRINLIGTLVYKSEEQNYSSCIVDDGSGKISLRVFANPNAFSKIDFGDFVLVIGKIREFGNEKYIMPEILKKIEIGWMSLRKAELGNKIVCEDKETEKSTASNDNEVYSLIKNLDKGDGVSFEDVIRNSAIDDAGTIITKLLENGDVFEVKPGKLKVLE